MGDISQDVGTLVSRNNTDMTRLFISYASPDAAFSLRLAGHLQQLGYIVWLDQWEIGAGEWIPSKIAAGIDAADYLLVILSRHTQSSVWVTAEVQMKFWQEVRHGQVSIVPVVIEDCVVPPLLQPKRAIDFRGGYEIGLAQISQALDRYHRLSGHATEVINIEAHTHLAFPVCTEELAAYTGNSMFRTPNLTEINVELSLPYIGKIAGVWKPAEEEQKAAWELYIELVTRVSIAGLPENQGLLRESLTSLYSIFTITRDILRRYGPAIARPNNGSEISFGALAIQIVNYVLRPVLTNWHPRLLDYEHQRPATLSAYQYEQQWEQCKEFRAALQETQTVLLEYSRLLAQVPNLTGVS